VLKIEVVIMVKKYIRFFNNIMKKYQISIIGAATSFYVIVALFSFSILAFQIYSFFSADFENYLAAKLLQVVNPLYYSLFNNVMPILTLNSFSFFIFFNLLWSASKVINGVNTVADIVYEEVKKRKEILNRISSLFMFLMLVFIVFFEIIFALYTNNIISIIIKNVNVLKVIQFIIEMIILFVTLTILYIYAPPIKMRFKDVVLGSVVATVLIYVSSVLLILVINVYQKINANYSVLTIISLFFLWIYIINCIIAFGIIINYRYNKFGIISHEKK
jgi:membrane protein